MIETLILTTATLEGHNWRNRKLRIKIAQLQYVGTRNAIKLLKQCNKKKEKLTCSSSLVSVGQAFRATGIHDMSCLPISTFIISRCLKFGNVGNLFVITSP